MAVPEQKPGRSRQDYSTPEDFLGAVLKFLMIDQFVFDFAADETNSVAAGYWNAEIDSLRQSPESWLEMLPDQQWGWLNPPFERIAPWVRLAYLATLLGARIAVLVPAGVGSDWWKEWVHGKASVVLLNGRLCFIKDWATTIDPATEKPGKGPPRCYSSPPLYPKDCCLLLYEPENVRAEGEPAEYQVWSWRDQAA